MKREIPAQLRVLRHGPFSLVTLGNFVSQLGSWAQNIGIGVVAVQLTDRPLFVGFAYGAQFVPSLVLAPFGGLAADRFDRRLITILGNIGMAVPAALIGLLLSQDRLTVTWLVLLALLSGTMSTFTQPAASALVPHLVPLAELPAAVSVNSALQNSTRFVGASLAAYLLRTFDDSVAFHFNAVSFLAVVLAWLIVRPKLPHITPSGETFWARLGGGLEFARRNVAVRNLLLVNAATTYFVMQAPLLPIISRELLDGDAGTFGDIQSASGIGAIAGALIAGQLVTDRRRRLAMVLGTSAATISVFGVGLSHSIPATLALQAMWGVGYFTVITVSMTVMMVVTPDEFRGRVMALQNLSLAGMIPLMSVSAGFLADRMGITGALVLAGSLQAGTVLWFVLGGGLAAIRFELEPDDEDAARPPMSKGEAAVATEVLTVDQ